MRVDFTWVPDPVFFSGRRTPVFGARGSPGVLFLQYRDKPTFLMFFCLLEDVDFYDISNYINILYKTEYQKKAKNGKNAAHQPEQSSLVDD